MVLPVQNSFIGFSLRPLASYTCVDLFLISIKWSYSITSHFHSSYYIKAKMEIAFLGKFFVVLLLYIKKYCFIMIVIGNEILI